MSNLSEDEREQLRVYSHISGLLGAATFASVFKDAIEWRAFILRFIEWWQEIVRPILHSVFWWIKAIWPWTWPNWGYDYVVLSLIFGLGGARFFSLFVPVRPRSFTKIDVSVGGWANSSQTKRTIAWPSIGRLAAVSIMTSLFWPVFLIGLTTFALISWANDGFSRPMREALFLALSPLLYFAVLLLLNYALFFADPT